MIKNGESGSKMVQTYGLGTSSILDSKKNSDTAMKLICSHDNQDGSLQDCHKTI